MTYVFCCVWERKQISEKDPKLLNIQILKEFEFLFEIFKPQFAMNHGVEPFITTIFQDRHAMQSEDPTVAYSQTAFYAFSDTRPWFCTSKITDIHRDH